MAEAMRLYQYQCQRDGTLFYYQTGLQVRSNRMSVVSCCPVCRSNRIEETGRSFAAIKEHGRLRHVVVKRG